MEVEEQSNQRSLDILFVEDNELTIKIGAIMLEKMGHKVDIAKRGKEAIEKCSAKYYDIIFLDIQMPEMDGYETARKIRELEKEFKFSRSFKIIALTGQSWDNERTKCLEAGMDEYLLKPFRKEEIRYIINSLVRS